MERYAGQICDLMLTKWHAATLTDYAALAMAVVVAGWFTSHISDQNK
jgi:hypothetical protein